MPSAELRPAATPTTRPQARTRNVWVSGWGGAQGTTVQMAEPHTLDGLRTVLELAESRHGALPRGMGRSYGDAAQLAGGVVVRTRGLSGFHFDADDGTVTAQAGATIAELLDATVPRGWMVPVVPGTQHVSVGGAIASDIHGKNHGVAGTFGSHVEQIELLSARGELLELSPGSDDRLFEATLGGMGLTGVIVSARIKLTSVSTPLLSVDTDRVEGLEQALEVLAAPGGPHRVAWLDLLGAKPGRGVVTRAEHLPADAAPAKVSGGPTVAPRATIPAGWPSGLLRPATVRAFNELRFRRTPRRQRGHVEGIGGHMFPLDALVAWPRLYGPGGLLQYQLVVPFGQEAVLETVIQGLRAARIPCYLAVLKDFGPANGAPLSFPIAGWTLALDVPRAAPGLDPLLDRFDAIVAEAGGRVYLSKDARLRQAALEAMYPEVDAWREVQAQADPEGVWRSDLALRTGLLTTAPTAGLRVAVGGSASANPERRVLVLGGTSEIGLAIVRRLAEEGPVRPYLIGRSEERLRHALSQLEAAGCLPGEVDVLEARDVASHADVLARAFDREGGFDTVVLAVGVLGGQSGVDADPEELLEVMEVNFTASGSLLLECVRRLRAQSSTPAPTLIVLSSVAAERPRASNAVYGAAKAGLDSLAQGIADATRQSGVRVLVVRPGFVTTRMTAGLEVAPMATTAEAVAEATVAALGTGA
ncbi:MAG TPA: SDR family NAD(P)-dependent oxidoreductase, partial [Solirubrobacteraceae bacterium]|nr:SDR family NAD(P)-dependent oxidoreductase [Solirubrobacteraceae bacterium]